MNLDTLNDQQKSAVLSDNPRILCLAGAGTGKTHSMLSRIFRLIEDGADPTSILALTFTNAAAFEMRQRYLKQSTISECPEFRTFHSFCYSIISKDAKIRNAIGYTTVPEVITEAEMKNLQTTLRISLNIKLSEKKLFGGHDLKTPQEKAEYALFQKALKKEIRKQSVITFDILCYDVCKLFETDDPLTHPYKDKYEYIFVDEFQDTDPKQFRFVSSFKDSKFFIVGDAQQCQPAGTQVMLADKTLKNIEDVQIGDRVVTYDISTHQYYTSLDKYPKPVSDISSRYAENVVQVSTSVRSSKYTLDHITYAHIHREGFEDKYAQCLIEYEHGKFYLTSVKLFPSLRTNVFGPEKYRTDTDAVAIWILDTGSLEYTTYQCAIQSIEYEIPHIDPTSDTMNIFGDSSDKLLSNYQASEYSVYKLLAIKNLDINYPLIYEASLKLTKRQSQIFPIRVMNLIPFLMDIVVPDLVEEPFTHHFEQIYSISSLESCIVYSLDIKSHHNYIADGILTHNCIYGFRGADSSIIKMLATLDDWETIRLERNYRSTKQICEYANAFTKQYVPDSHRVEITSDREGAEIEFSSDHVSYFSTPVDTRTIQDILERLPELKGTSAILCRTNREVNYLCQLLDDNNVDFSISNKSFQDTLDILKSVSSNDYMLDWLSSCLDAEKYAEYLRITSLSDSYSLQSFLEDFGQSRQLKSRVSTILEIRKLLRDESLMRNQKIMKLQKLLHTKLPEVPENISDVKGLISFYLEELSQSKDSDLYLGTIHSSKGLEYDNVFIPNIGVTKVFEIVKEDDKNLLYVGITRAKSRLFLYMC